MATPRLFEGGEIEIHDVMPDVTFADGIISPAVAHHASRTAMRFLRDWRSLPFIREHTDEGANTDTSTIVTLGVYPPCEWGSNRGTIFGDPGELRSAYSLLWAAKRLCRFAGVNFFDVDCVNLQYDLPNTSIPAHDDPYDYSRSYLQILGTRIMGFGHRRPVQADTHLLVERGQGYRMQFRGSGYSVPHEADYLGECLALYVDVPNETE